MAVIAFKSRSSDLRTILKVFKQHFDDLTTLRRYEPTLRRLLFLNSSPHDQPWRGEGLHQLALMHEASGNDAEAEKYFLLSLETFEEHELLGLARAMRDYGLFMARNHDLEAGHMQIKQALALHDDDLRNARGQRQRDKGQRQRRITESYVWRARLLIDRRDKRARNSLVEFALTECHDCSLRDQQQVIEFVIPFTKGAQRQMLNARLIEINARRHNISGVVTSMAKLVIGTQLTIAGKIIRTLTRKG